MPFVGRGEKRRSKIYFIRIFVWIFNFPISLILIIHWTFALRLIHQFPHEAR